LFFDALARRALEYQKFEGPWEDIGTLEALERALKRG